jgi:hypothetical protein
MTNIQHANNLIEAGISVIPVKTDGSKAPAVKTWAQYQKAPPSNAEAYTMFKHSNNVGIAIICGAVSGGLEIIDIDDPDAIQPWILAVEKLGEGELMATLPLVSTPTGGLHAYYRCNQIDGNQKLAMKLSEDGKPKVKMETRGEGGYVLTPYCPPACHPLNKDYELTQGDLLDIPVITPEQREVLITAAQSLNEITKAPRISASTLSQNEVTGAGKPGDDFNRKARWEDILEPNGWERAYENGDKAYWRKPGKKGRGISATSNYGDTDLLYVFSTSADPFEPDQAYTKFAAYALLDHGGDFSAAAGELAKQGFGKPAGQLPTPLESLAATDWSEPKKIEQTLLPVPALPQGMLPDTLDNWSEDISYRMQAPREFVAVASLVMLSSIIGTACTIKPKQKDDWTCAPNVWGAIVARPGAMKTPVFQEALKPMKRLEEKAHEENQLRRKDYEAAVVVHKGAQDKLKSLARSQKAVDDSENLKRKWLALEEPAKPVSKRYLINDSTIEKITELLNENPRGLLYHRDELVGWFASMDKQGREGDRTYFLESWDGLSSRVDDRIGRGTIFAKSLSLSILGGIQPGKLQAYLRDSAQGTENDGLIQRFQLIVFPDERNDWQLIDEFPNTKARDRVFELVEKLSIADFTQYGAIQNDSDKFPYMRFNYEAQLFFNEWRTALQSKISREDNDMIREHLSKYSSLMPSLALIFHLVEVVDGTIAGSVSLKAAQLSASWCTFLEAHARRIYGLVSDISVKAASNLAEKISKGLLPDGFAIREIQRKEWAFLKDNSIIRAACEELCDAGWIREQHSGNRTIYAINPKAINLNVDA